MNGRRAEWALTHPQYPEAADLLASFESLPVDALLARAAAVRDEGFGRTVTFSRKVFIPLTAVPQRHGGSRCAR